MVGDRENIRILEASEELGVARSTAHRLMQMLQYHGFVRQARRQSKTYTVGPVLFDMGLQVVRNLDIRSHARPSLERLAHDLDETVQLFVLQQSDHLACIDAIESTRALRVGGRSGVVVPAFATAAGHALLAEMAPNRIRQIYPNEQLPEIAGASSPRSELERDLALTRERGYAVQRGEMDPEVSAVAASDTRHGLGRANFAVGIAVPTSRLTEEDSARRGAAAQGCAGGHRCRSALVTPPSHAGMQPSLMVSTAELRSLEPGNRERYVAKRDEQQRMLDRVILDGVTAGSSPPPSPPTRAAPSRPCASGSPRGTDLTAS